MRVVGVDPGKTCGMALIDFDTGETGVISKGMNGVEARLDKWNPELVVIERWVIYPFALHRLKFHECPAAEAIGMVRSWCNRNEVPLVRQMASVRVPYMERARKVAGVVDHRADALAHIFCWAKVNEPERWAKYLEEEGG